MDTQEILAIVLAALFNTKMMIDGGITILMVLIAPCISVNFSVLLLRYKIKFEDYAFSILTWGGLPRRVFVALPLSLSAKTRQGKFVPVTYITVVFSILLQGLIIGKLVPKLQGNSISRP